MSSLELNRSPLARGLLLSRWPQFLVRAIGLAGIAFTILAGLMGTPVGGRNFAVIIVWIAWWTALKLVFIPFGGRSWCSICPIPMPGEWLQQGGLVRFNGQGLGLGKRWPKALRGRWLQAGGFLAIGLFAALTLTSARVTAFVLLGIIALSVTISLVFERRAFCSYLCPVGGFTGLYAQAAPVELRVKDPRVCAEHAEKTCYTSCPWGQYPLALKSNAPCGLCMECLRVCPEDNIAVNLRPFGSDLARAVRPRLDEAFLGLVMLSSALADAAIFLGPWGKLKLAAYTIGSREWLLFCAGFLSLSLVLLPGLYYLAVWLGVRRSEIAGGLKKALAGQGMRLVPLGLSTWMAFTVAFAFTKFSYVLAVLSDPLGRGWNLLGTSNSAWPGQMTPFGTALQIALLVGGLYWSLRIPQRAGDTPGKPPFSMALFSLAFTLAMAWLLIG